MNRSWDLDFASARTKRDRRILSESIDDRFLIISVFSLCLMIYGGWKNKVCQYNELFFYYVLSRKSSLLLDKE